MTPASGFDMIFSAASTAVLPAWLWLIAAPRRPLAESLIRNGLVAALSLTYSVLVMLFFFRAEGGGFGSIAEVRALFMSDGGLLAGWIHYLAFDLLIGLWIAGEADRIGLNRLIQAPILILTFLFGPLGWLLFMAVRSVDPSRLLARKA